MIDIKINTISATRFLNNIAAKQIPYAAMNTLNNVAFKGKDEEVKALSVHLDRPTPFTQRGYEVVKASRGRLIASIRARQIQAQYLKFQVEGGLRGPKGRAIVLPKAVGLNAYGNMPKGRVKSLMQQKTVFSGKVRGKAGIWRRTGGKKNRSVKLLIAYTGKASYAERLPFGKATEVTVGKMFKPEFDLQLARALASAK